MKMQTAREIRSAEAPAFANMDALREPGERRRLSGPALRLFFRVAELWGLTIEQQKAVLGDVSKQTYYNWKAGKAGVLTRDQIERISLVLGILKGLRLIFADEAVGVRWLKSDHPELPFGRNPPLDRKAHDGINDLNELRPNLDTF